LLNEKSMPQLSLKQRYQIEAMKRLGYGVSDIARRYDMAKSTVSRELRRNSKNGRYDAERAQKMSRGRRRRGPTKLNGALLQKVEAMLNLRHSPEQISGRLEQQGEASVSHEAIYQHVYRDRAKGGSLYTNLRFARKKRRKRLSVRQKRGQIPNKTMIAQRPAEVENRERFGDWEGDTIVGGAHQGVVVTLVERKSKYTVAAKAGDKSAAAVEKVVVELLQNAPLPTRTITFDNGTEFSNHQKISETLNATVYFANPYHSWERGLNENTNGLIRQFIPKKQNLKELDESYLKAVQENLNNRPRKTLGFLSPIEFFNTFPQITQPVAFET